MPGADAPRPSRRAPAGALALLLAASAAACTPGAGPTPTGNPSAGPSAGPTAGPTTAPTVAGGIEHPTGATDIILRVEEGGGFAPIEWNATAAPSFTLYGDGTVVFRDQFEMPPQTNDNLMRFVEFQTVKLDEAGIQALLEFAIGPGGLAAATGPYNGLSIDLPTTTFTINAGGRPEPKQVMVTGVSPDAHPGNELIIASLQRLYERLRTFGTEVAAQPYVAPAYRGVLIESEQPVGPVVDWPWDDLAPEDFTGEQEFFRSAQLTLADVEALGVSDIGGGFSGISLSVDGDIYSFALRPLLPDELQAD